MSNGKEYDYTDLAEMFYKKWGKHILFDTEGWNPKNKVLQARAEKYFEYFSKPGNEKKIQYNLSINPFHPWYVKAYELGYRAGRDNDLKNPDIQIGKKLYDLYIERMANMIATLGPSGNANILLTYSARYEKNMHGMYLSDLKLILIDVEKRCNEILKEKYPDEYRQKSEKISRLISSSVNHAEGYNVQPRCAYAGRYKELYNSRNPNNPREDTKITPNVPDINTLSPKEFEEFFKNHVAIVDANGKIYYQRYDTSVRSLGKELKLSTNGKQTPKIANLELRE